MMVVIRWSVRWLIVCAIDSNVEVTINIVIVRMQMRNQDGGVCNCWWVGSCDGFCDICM